MRLAAVALLVQALAAPDPAQMEKAPDLGYRPVEPALTLPADIMMGAPASVATTKDGHLLVFNRGPHPLIEFDQNGRFIRSFGESLYDRPHGMRIDARGDIWTTDVNTHVVRKMNARGEVLLTLGTKGESGVWDEAAGSHRLAQPTDIGFGPAGVVYVLQGHGEGEPRVLKFDGNGRFIAAWGGKGSGPGQFDIAHSIVIDGRGLVYIADRQNRRVQIFDENGRFVREWKFAGLPCGLSLGPKGQMYLVTGFAGQVLRLDSDGRAVGATGEAGKGLGRFGEAHYLAFGPNQEIYVADTTNAVLHKFVMTRK